jgi:hypothetical protein
VSELEIINLQRGLSLKTRVKDSNFWNLVPSEKCPITKRMSLKVTVCFGCTNLSESEFSTMRILKSNYAVSSIALNSITSFGWTIFLRKHYINS